MVAATPRRHFGSGPVRLAEVVRAREAPSAPAVRVPLDAIDPSPRNPRRSLDVAELADSIRAYGLLQPVLLRRAGARYELVAGHRRYAAVRLLAEKDPADARWREIEAVLRQADQEGAYLLTLVENLQRVDLSPKEEATALEVLVRQEGWSVRKVAEAIHRQPSYVSRRLRVFDDAALAPVVLANRLPVSTAEELLRAPIEERADYAERAITEGWNAHEARHALRECCDSQRAGDVLVTKLRDAAAALERIGANRLTPAQLAEVRSIARGLTTALG